MYRCGKRALLCSVLLFRIEAQRIQVGSLIQRARQGRVRARAQFVAVHHRLVAAEEENRLLRARVAQGAAGGASESTTEGHGGGAEGHGEGAEAAGSEALDTSLLRNWWSRGGAHCDAPADLDSRPGSGPHCSLLWPREGGETVGKEAAEAEARALRYQRMLEEAQSDIAELQQEVVSLRRQAADHVERQRLGHEALATGSCDSGPRLLASPERSVLLEGGGATESVRDKVFEIQAVVRCIMEEKDRQVVSDSSTPLSDMCARTTGCRRCTGSRSGPRGRRPRRGRKRRAVAIMNKT